MLDENYRDEDCDCSLISSDGITFYFMKYFLLGAR